MKVLIIEDEISLQDSVKSYFKVEGHVPEVASTFNEAEEKIHLYQYDCILVDINLPDGSGFDLITQIRKVTSDTGIIIVSAREAIDDRIKGLELGADDYLVKPFHLSELNARVNSIIRRLKFKGEDAVMFHEIALYPQERHVTINKKTVELTRKEYDILLYFITNKNRVLTKESIGEHLWGDFMDASNSFDFVYTHIKNLRKKLIDAGCTDYIKNVYGMGYKFTDVG
ncbi:MAG: response regulator transcription factor [Bacteroidota bacterium]